MAGPDGWQEAGKKLPVVQDVEIIAINPMEDPRYASLIADLRTWHSELLKQNLVENPALVGDYLGKLRLNCNLLFSFLNKYIDAKVEAETAVAVKRQNIYETTLEQPKKSENAASKAAAELTRIDEANVRVIENRIKQIQNEYERYNGICMYLQSRMKEFNSERMMG